MGGLEEGSGEGHCIPVCFPESSFLGFLGYYLGLLVVGDCGVWGREGYGFHFSFDDDFGFIVDDAFVAALDKSLETRWPEINKTW